MRLTSENIEHVIMDCLFKEGEDTSKAVVAEGVQIRIGFHPERLRQRESDIFSMLKCLPDQFMQSGGGGYTFLNACVDKVDVQWTGSHEQVDKLLALGLAIDKASILLPREMWDVLPGGMPYFVVKDKEPVQV